MKKIFLQSCCWILAIIIPLVADVPAPGVDMPEKVRDALSRMAESLSDGNLARIIRQRKTARIQRSGTLTIDAMQFSVPLLLGYYSDAANAFSRDDFQRQIFDDNPTGTMIDYYREASYGQFELSGDAFGWYKLPESQAFYVGGNSGLNGGGARFARDLAVAADPDVDYSRFDADDDGYVDVIMVVHTGAGAETGVSDNIWSHRWSFSGAANYAPDLMPQGVYVTDDPWPGHPGQFIKIDDYIIQPELSGPAGGLIDIGVFCHEFGHALGLPDLYDTDYSSDGIGNWGLMAGGSYGGDGRHPNSPAHFCAWSKEFLGWIEPSIINSEAVNQDIFNAEENADQIFKVLVNGEEGPEYFLIENRQKIGFDRYLSGDGLLIWHIDQDVIDARFNSNSVNNDENRKGVDLEEADGLRQLDFNSSRGDAGDPFPGSSNNTLFNSSSNPNSNTNDGLDSGVAIRIDSHENRVVTVSYLLTPELSVSPLERSVAYDSGIVVFNVSNVGGGVMNWEATAGAPWLAIAGESTGVNSGEFIVAYSANTTAEPRSGVVTVTADDASREIVITQSAAGEWTLDLHIMDDGGEQTTVTFGQLFGATDGIDAELGEAVLPPTPPAGSFDARLQLADSDIASARDFRAPGAGWLEWRLLFQAGEGGFPMELTWDKNSLPQGSFFIKDEFTGTLISVDMNSVENLVVPTSSIKSLKIIYADVSPQTVQVNDGWNLLSIPFNLGDMRPRILFPSAISSAFTFVDKYIAADVLKAGRAYWVKFAKKEQFEFFGPLASPEIDVRAGWNMIGPLDKEVDAASIVTSPANIIASEFYEFDDGYVAADRLAPGRGYWVMALQDGKMLLNAAPALQKPLSSVEKDWAVLTFSDAKHRSKTLYVADRDVRGFHLPPLPPGDAWDVRFDDDRQVCRAGDERRILLRGAVYPVAVNIVHGDRFGISLTKANGAAAPDALPHNESTVILADAADLLLVSGRTPLRFELLQNYPNPFNPTTTIRFAVPAAQHVTLRVYNSRGRLIETIVDDNLEAGWHSAAVNAADYASGVYIYRLAVGGFSTSKKMIVLH